MNGAEFIEGVRRRLQSGQAGNVTDRDVAHFLGIGLQALTNWRERNIVTARQMVGGPV